MQPGKCDSLHYHSLKSLLGVGDVACQQTGFVLASASSAGLVDLHAKHAPVDPKVLSQIVLGELQERINRG